MSLKKTIAIFCLALAYSSCFAQEEVGTFTIQPKAGICIPTNDASSDATEKDSHRKVCFTGGVELEYQFSKKFSATIGAMYSHRNIEIDEEYVDHQTDFDVYYGYYFNSQIDLLEVPLMVNFYPIKGLAVKAGIQTNFILNYSYTTDCEWFTHGTAGDWSSYDVSNYTGYPTNFPYGLCTYFGDLYSDQHKVSISIPVGLSYEFKHFVLDARYNIGLTKIATNNLTNSSYKGSCFYITLGYKFAL